MANARKITKGLQPILAADILDFGDRYEIHTGDNALVLYSILNMFMYIIIDLPGVHKNDLDVTIQNGLITIKGERKKKYEEDDVWGTHRIERSHGKVSRTLALPVDCDGQHADASFEGGVLKVTFPKLASTSASSKKLLIT